MRATGKFYGIQQKNYDGRWLNWEEFTSANKARVYLDRIREIYTRCSFRLVTVYRQVGIRK